MAINFFKPPGILRLPPGKLKVDWSHPLLNRISYLRIFNAANNRPFIDAGNDDGTTPISLDSGAVISALPAGIGLTGEGMSILTAALPSYAVPSTAGSCFAYSVASWSPTDSASHHLVRVGAGAPTSFSIQKFSDNNWYAGWTGGTDNRATGAASGTFTAGESFSLGCTWGSAGTAFYTKGISRYTNAGAINSGNTSGGTIAFNCNGPASNVWDTNVGKGGTYYIAFWSRVLTIQEIRTLAFDPFCFLLPDEGEWPAVFVAAGAVVPTSGGTLPFMGVG